MADGPRIAVVGGGIGGLATAAFLHRAGLRCTVHEQASALREIGAGLVLTPNAARLLRRIGALQRMRDALVPLDIGWEFRRWEDGRVLSAEDLSGACEDLYGERTSTVHRADLLDAIRAAVPEGSIRLGRRCGSVEVDGDGAVLGFADGSTERADLVIGADGVHSTVRGAITRPAPATDSGIAAFRALVPAERAPAFARRAAQTLWVGPGRHFVHYPVSGGRMVNLVAFAPAGRGTVESWSATASVREFLDEFAGWDPRVTALIGNAGAPGRWALLDRAPLARWTQGPVTLLGDAAHPMFPFFAQGAAQSVEDAAVLARCLAADPSPQGLARYESVRRGRTTRMQEVSHGRAHLNHLPDGPAQRERDAVLAAADPLVANGWIYAHDAEAGLPD